MAGGDGTGPRGLGPGTGWGRGPCGAGLRRGAFGYAGRGGRGPGRGGRGAWGWWSQPALPAGGASWLRRQEQLLSEELKRVRDSLAALGEEN